MKRSLGKLLILIISIVLIVGGSILISIMLRQNPNLDSVKEVTKLVSKHYILPTNEEPALATVEDKSKLKSDFFRNAENGDKLLVYKNNKKVILYRPSVDKLIEVGPVSLATAGDVDKQ